MEKLNTSGGGAVTVAVLDDETVDPSEVKHHQVAKGGWLGTRVTGRMPELKNEAKRCEGALLKEATIPLLRTCQ